MRNIFDQYVQAENRITHALMTALNEDRRLLSSFLKDIVRIKPPVDVRRLKVLEQRYPGDAEPNEQELERRGVPDGWIAAEEQAWCVLIETKVLIKLRESQIESHKRTAVNRGFRTIKAIAITPQITSAQFDDTLRVGWREIYEWLVVRREGSVWAAHAASYLEIAEAKLIDSDQLVEGTLTMFTGFPFGPNHPYTYLEGKRLLQLALGDLRKHRELRGALGMNPGIAGRPAITGKNADSVWDFLSISKAADEEAFTRYPHLTLGVAAQAVEATVTVPNSVNTSMRQKLLQLGEDGFQELIGKILHRMAPLLKRAPGASPWFRGVQRRYPSQRAIPFIDARLEFDLRTALPSKTGPKEQLRWLSAAYGSFVNKQSTNYQIQVGVLFNYERCPEIHRPTALELIADAWIGCKPLLDTDR